MELLKYPFKDDIPIGFPWDVTWCIAGVPRGGTQFITNCIRAVLADTSCKVSHEALFSPHYVRDFGTKGSHDIEVSGFAWPYLKMLGDVGVTVIHLIRHPVSSANSLFNYFPNSFKTVADAADMWLEWHSVNELHSDIAFRVEDQSHVMLRYLSVSLGFKYDLEECKTICEEADRGRRSPGDAFTWWDLPTAVRDYAEFYGYGPDLPRGYDER